MHFPFLSVYVKWSGHLQQNYFSNETATTVEWWWRDQAWVNVVALPPGDEARVKIFLQISP